MQRPAFLRRAALLGAIVLALSAPALAANVPPYTMTLDNGFICVRENATGEWIFRSAVRGELLSQRDQLLLESGIFLHNQTEFTRAVEDFCS